MSCVPIPIRARSDAAEPPSVGRVRADAWVCAPGGRAVTEMTGTLRDYRGRGLALLAKRATLVNAAKRGVELVFTENDETNGPMLRVNEKLGYRPIGSTVRWSRP